MPYASCQVCYADNLGNTGSFLHCKIIDIFDYFVYNLPRIYLYQIMI